MEPGCTFSFECDFKDRLPKLCRNEVIWKHLAALLISKEDFGGQTYFFYVFSMCLAHDVCKVLFHSMVLFPELHQQVVQFSSEYFSLWVPGDLVDEVDPSPQLLVVVHLPVHRPLQVLGAQL